MPRQNSSRGKTKLGGIAKRLTVNLTGFTGWAGTQTVVVKKS
jgi:hypothetical protein